MARTRRIDDIDKEILGLLSGETRITDIDSGHWWDYEKERGYKFYSSKDHGDVKTVKEDLERVTGERHKLATIRYRLSKLEEMGQIRRTGNCGWGRSYSYVYITDEERKQKAKKQAEREFRASFYESLKAMLESVNVEVPEWGSIDNDGMVEVRARDLARLLRANYDFEDVYDEESESQSA
jgi:DNA-binding Lrp family transcriptional regulator